MSSQSSCTTEDIKDWLQPVLEEEGLENYIVSVSGISEKGDGYLGDITFVDVTGNTKTEPSKTYNFVLKCGKKSVQLREMMPIRAAFENEINFYNDVLRTFREFQNERGITEPFNNAPKCYRTVITDNIEVLILENLKSKHYEVHDRTKTMNEAHILSVIRAYAKLHAISYALRDQKPTVFKKLSSSLVDILKCMFNQQKTAEPPNMFNDVLSLSETKHDEELLEKVLKLNELAASMNEITDPDDPYAVVLHGDCWNNNFMFKYKNAEKTLLEEVCLIDFQISRLASPVFDLSYFLFTCISPEDIPNFDKINSVYYDSLCDFMQLLGSDPTKMFPYEEFLNQWKRFSLFGLIMMPGLIKICLSEKDEVHDLTEVAESGLPVNEAFSYTVRNIKEYERRTLSVIKFAIKRELV